MTDKIYLRYAIVACLMAIGCSKSEYPGLGKQDSLLVTTLKEPSDTAHPQPVTNAAVMDSLKIREERDKAKLERLTPMQVVQVYDGYRPLRNANTSQTQLDSFLMVMKITRDELHAVLAEGDRLGWAK
ncbi:MAG: hypothetical protein Q8922_10315 [Bacteroidota bacterium]|nr:hypothetical protein [Bacteroidota bacterium]MDP4233910.1 hypothetical protein [Bacteroidota bacterium]MDP4242840.1 hypothetical protein [Bacteroidota bacterium]MDP4288318.1 hypothetical protein [Bacteroidota bacterium]